MQPDHGVGGGPPRAGSARRKKSLGIRLAVSSAALVVALVGAEVGFRLFGEAVGIDVELIENYERFVSKGGLLFEPRAHTVFTRRPNTWSSNSMGFRGPEWTLEKEPGVTRIACLGGSTTEGGNPEGPEGRYPVQLEMQLQERTGAQFEVMNFGMSGWTTAESLILWFLTVQDYDPDLVIVHHAVNDVGPRNRDDYRPDYTHYRRPWQPPRVTALDRWAAGRSKLLTWLLMDPKELRNIGYQTTFRHKGVHPFQRTGEFPPGSDHGFRRNIENIGASAESRGTAVMLLTMPYSPVHQDESSRMHVAGMIDHNRILREIAADRGWMLADAEPWPELEPELANEAFVDLVHLHPSGNAAKARIVADVLMREWIPTLAASGQGASSEGN